MSKDLIIAKQRELIEDMLTGYPTPLSMTAKRLRSELAALEKEPTAMEMIREVFEPLQLPENEIVNQALELASKKAGKIRQESEVTDEIQVFMNDVHKWADDTFGKERTALAPLYHLKKEVVEAIEAMQTHNSWITIEELADCFILILNASSKYKLSFTELFDAAKEKMIVNKSRKWGKPDKNGVVEHIKDTITTDDLKDLNPQPKKIMMTSEEYYKINPK